MMISYAQNFEDVMLWRALGHVDKGFYIDIGAQDPVVDSVSRAFYEKGWRGIHVEADPAYAALLKEDRPDEKVIQAAVTNARGAMTFYEIPDTGLSTGDRSIAKKHKERGFEIREIKVPCMTLEDLFRQAGQRDIHWLKIDVEGMEQQVLRGWGRSKARPWIVVVESTLPMTQTETHADWEPLLLKKGYKPVYFDGLNRYYRSSGRPRLAAAFRTGPNIFDDFQLHGTASAPFCRLVNERHQQQEQEHSRQLQGEQQKRHESERESEQRERALNDQISRTSREIDGLRRTLDEKEQDLSQQLHAEQQKRQAIERGNEQREKTLSEQISRYRNELDELRKELGIREQDLGRQLQAEHQKRQAIELESARRAAQVLAMQQQAARDIADQARIHREQERALQKKHADRERSLVSQLLAGRQELRGLMQDQSEREKALSGLVAQATQKRHQDMENLLLSFAGREKEFGEQLLAAQKARDEEKSELQRRHTEQEMQLRQEFTARENSMREEGVRTLAAARTEAQQEIAEQNRIHTEEVRELKASLAQQQEVYQALQFQLNELKTHLANAAVTRHPDGAAAGTTVDAASVEHVDQLLMLHDAAFIDAVYHTLLGRDPDSEGMDYYLKRLRAGYGKVAVLVQIAAGPEAREKGADLRGLRELIGVHRKANSWFQRLRTRNGQNEQYVHCLENELWHVFRQVEKAQAESAERLVRLEHAIGALTVPATVLSKNTSIPKAQNTPKTPVGQSRPDLNDLTPRGRQILDLLTRAKASASEGRSL